MRDDSGVFAVSRSIWSHEALFDDQPYSKREAWIWLISAAAWKPIKLGFAGRVIALERGEFCFSIRFLAEKWQWTKAKVEWFLNTLKKHDMLQDRKHANCSVYKVNNYNRYQKVGLPKQDTSQDEKQDTNRTATGHEQDKEETLKHSNINKKEDKGAGAPICLPNWLPIDAWEGFVEMRSKIKKPITERARSRAISKLNDLRSKGHDPAEVLDQSTLNCWQDLWPIKSETRIETRNSPNVRPNKFDAIFEGVAAFVRDNSEEASGVGTGATADEAGADSDYAGGAGTPPGTVGTGLCVVSSNPRPSTAQVPSLLRRSQVIDGGRRSHSDPDVFESSA